MFAGKHPYSEHCLLLKEMFLFEPLCWTKSEPAVYQILQNNFAPGGLFTAYQRLVATYTVLLEVAGKGTGSQATHTMHVFCGVNVNVVAPCNSVMVGLYLRPLIAIPCIAGCGRWHWGC